jgi:hypothetical protein
MEVVSAALKNSQTSSHASFLFSSTPWHLLIPTSVGGDPRHEMHRKGVGITAVVTAVAIKPLMITSVF